MSSKIADFPERELTEEEWRQLFQNAEFEPPTLAEGKPTSDQFIMPPDDEAMCNDLVWVRTAFGFLLQTKEKLTEFAGEMLTLPDEEFENFVQEMARVERNLKRMARTMEVANMRLCAAAHCATPPNGGRI